MCPRPSPVLKIGVMRRAANGGKDQVVVTDLKPSVRRTPVHGKRRRRMHDCLKQQVRVKAHHKRVFANVKARVAIVSSSLFAQYLDAFITQQIERGQVNRLNFIFAELCNRGIGVF